MAHSSVDTCDRISKFSTTASLMLTSPSNTKIEIIFARRNNEAITTRAAEFSLRYIFQTVHSVNCVSKISVGLAGISLLWMSVRQEMPGQNGRNKVA